MSVGFGFSDGMFNSQQKINFHAFKNGEQRFRVLPPYAPEKLFLQVDLHWGFTDENNKKKALKCTQYEFKTCAICDEAAKIKADIDMLTKNAQGMNADELKTIIDEKKARHNDIKKKSSYLWNIIADDGQQKVLQLSWNGHEPLHNKVKFLWEISRTNITDMNANQQMWVSRTGQGAQTRYQYELVANSAIKIENVKELIDLSKVYKESTPSELKEIMMKGYVANAKTNSNDSSFAASFPTGPAPTSQEAEPNYQEQFDQATTPKAAAPVATPNIDDDIAKMQAILNQ